MNKKIILIFFSVTLALLVIYYIMSHDNSVKCNFNCEYYQGKILKISTDIKGYKSIVVENDTTRYLGIYLGKDGANQIQTGDSVHKTKGSMKLEFFRNNEYLYNSYNKYYSNNLSCNCN